MKRDIAPQESPRLARRTAKRALFFATGAATLYGTWAFAANRSGGTAASLHAALTQGCVSFAATLVQVTLLETFFRIGKTPAQGFFAAVGGTIGVCTGLGAIAHVIVGTPHILATLAPTTAVALVFNVIYARQLYAAATARRGALLEPSAGPPPLRLTSA